MRHLFLLLAISILSIDYTNAQIKELHSTINRDKPNDYYVVSEEGDSTLISKFNTKKDRLSSTHEFKLIPGEGRTRDEMGTREKNKMYLVNKLGDTLLTARKKSNNIEFPDGTFLTKLETDDGWDFIDNTDKIVYKLDLLWNKSKWKYNIKIYDNNENIDNLNKYLSITLSDMAKYKSIDDNYDDGDLWFVMWLAAL